MASEQDNLKNQNRAYLAKLHRREATFQSILTNFLGHQSKKILILEMGNLLLSVLSVRRALKRLDGDLKDRYSDDVMFFNWEQVSAFVGETVLSQPPNLMVVEQTATNDEDDTRFENLINSIPAGSRKKIIIIACDKGRWNRALQALDSGSFSISDESDITATSESRRSTTLFEAASQGFEDEIEGFIQAGADINQPGDAYQNTALHAAAEHGHVNVVSKLLEHEAQHLKNLVGDAPIHFAARHGHRDIVTMLLKNGVDINVTGSRRCTPLHLAVENGHVNVVVSLLQLKASQYNVNFRSECPIHVAAKKGHHVIMGVLLENGVNVDVTGWEKYTPLHYASEKGNDNIVRILMDYEANLEARNSPCETPLHLAAKEGHKHVVKTLLNGGAKVNTSMSTPLHYAVRSRQLEIVKILAEVKNIHLNCVDTTGATPLADAIRYECGEIENYLISKGAITLD